MYVIAILLYALSISIDRVIRREFAEDNTAKLKVDDSALPMYTAPSTQTKLPFDGGEAAKAASSHEAATVRKSNEELSAGVHDSKNPEDKKKPPNALPSRSVSPTCSQVGCAEGIVGEKEEELVPLHPGRRKSVGALLWEKTPFFVIVAVVVLLAIIIHAFSPLYLNYYTS